MIGAPRIHYIASFVLACAIGGGAFGQEMHRQHDTTIAGKAPVFIAGTAKPFAILMEDAMAVMDDGMRRAPMNGVSEHDFATMMIPHHQ